jgi:hypothetical protein
MFESLINFIPYVLTHIDFYGLIFPLLIYTILIAIYGIFIWGFYKSVSKRDLFKLEIRDTRKAWHKRVIHIVKYVVAFPVLIFVWFAALTIILFFLSKTQSTETIMLISMAVIAATRIGSYYKEEMSQEIAKILPLAVLGIFLVDPTFFSLQTTLDRFYDVGGLSLLLANYLIFVVVMEFVMRMFLTIRTRIRSYNENKCRKAAAKKPVKDKTVQKSLKEDKPAKAIKPKKPADVNS